MFIAPSIQKQGSSFRSEMWQLHHSHSAPKGALKQKPVDLYKHLTPSGVMHVNHLKCS
jgi:hypothetical protein